MVLNPIFLRLSDSFKKMFDGIKGRLFKLISLVCFRHSNQRFFGT